jgi:hypothetical protein
MAMRESWRPTPGQVALIELDERDDCLTGVVLPGYDPAVVIDLGASPAVPKEPCHVYVSFFAPDALYKVRGTASPHGEDALIDLSIESVERVQRRTAARARVAVHAALTAFTDDGAFVSVVGKTIDIGEGGCRVRTSMPFPAQKSPTISLQLPDGGTLAASSEILQAETVDGHFEYRLAFMELEKDGRTQLAELAQR